LNVYVYWDAIISVLSTEICLKGKYPGVKTKMDKQIMEVNIGTRKVAEV